MESTNTEDVTILRLSGYQFAKGPVISNQRESGRMSPFAEIRNGILLKRVQAGVHMQRCLADYPTKSNFRLKRCLSRDVYHLRETSHRGHRDGRIVREHGALNRGEIPRSRPLEEIPRPVIGIAPAAVEH